MIVVFSLVSLFFLPPKNLAIAPAAGDLYLLLQFGTRSRRLHFNGILDFLFENAYFEKLSRLQKLENYPASKM